MEEVVHSVPIGEESLTRCCSRSPFDLPWDDRMTSLTGDVTCSGSAPRAHWSGPVMERRYWLTDKGWAAVASSRAG